MSLEMIKLAAAAATDRKASRIVALDLRGLSDMCDMQIVCSGENDKQTRAIADGITESIQGKLGLKPMAVEGRTSGNWILLDYGAVLIHIFLAEYRDFYAIESIWPNAKPLPL